MTTSFYSLRQAGLFTASLFAIILMLAAINGCAPLNSPTSATDAAPEADQPAAANESSSSGGAAHEVATEDTAGTNADDSNAESVAADSFEGVPVGYTDEGYIFRGNPDAPVTMYEYSDYQCPYCRRHFLETEPALNETYIQNGQLKVVFMDFPLEQLHPHAPAAAAAALCVADQSANAFWQMHNLLFETQDEWSRHSEPSAIFSDLAEQTGIDMDAFAACLDSGAKDADVQRTFRIGNSIGFSGTPSFQFVIEETGETAELVGAQPFERFATWIDTMLEGEIPAEAQQEPSQGDDEIPYWATDEGLSPDPDRPGYTMAGDQYRGAPDAKVVVIEYSDFQCPYCGRHFTNTQPVLDEMFVDTGEVRWVFKHFPLNIHPQAPAAGVAAECAAEQDTFWEMHHLLFENVSEWSVREPNPIFVELATELDLDVEMFEACLANEEMAARVESDFADGRPFVQGTPTFIVMFGGQGRIIPGALPADSFVEALDTILADAE